MKTICLAAALLAALSLPACTPSQKEGAGRAWQVNECNKVIDKEDRDRCIKRANG